MRTIFGTLLVAAIVAAASLAFAVGENATDFTLTDIKGQEFRLGDHLGSKVIVMSFWASWCKPCMVEMPQLEALYKKYKSQGVVVVSINVDEPSGVTQAKTIVRQNKVTFPVVLDTATKVTGIYNPSKNFPFTLVIGKDGKIAFVKTGFSAGDEKILEKEIQQVLKGKEEK